MSNHIHTVVHTNPLLPQQWEDKEIARRWLRLYPPRDRSTEGHLHALNALIANPTRLKELRRRLGCLSWFMRLLKEPLARLANKEDGCTGHFWEGRFANIESLNDEAVLSQMVYVDLNPVRAGLAPTPAKSPFTSIQYRIKRGDDFDGPLTPVAGAVSNALPDITFGDYTRLVYATAHVSLDIHSLSRTVTRPLPDAIPSNELEWRMLVFGTETLFHRAIGSVSLLEEKAKSLNQRFIWGIGARRKLLRKR